MLALYLVLIVCNGCESGTLSALRNPKATIDDNAIQHGLLPLVNIRTSRTGIDKNEANNDGFTCGVALLPDVVVISSPDRGRDNKTAIRSQKLKLRRGRTPRYLLDLGLEVIELECESVLTVATSTANEGDVVRIVQSAGEPWAPLVCSGTVASVEQMSNGERYFIEVASSKPVKDGVVLDELGRCIGVVSGAIGTSKTICISSSTILDKIQAK